MSWCGRSTIGASCNNGWIKPIARCCGARASLPSRTGNVSSTLSRFTQRKSLTTMKGEFCVATDGSVVQMDHRARNSMNVLMYHRIVDDESRAQRHWTCVHVDNLAQQLHMLDRCGFTTITFNDYRLSLSGQVNLPRKPVVISFDDGYLDTYRLAFPVLRELGMKAVVFVVAGKNVKSNIWDRHIGVPP